MTNPFAEKPQSHEVKIENFYWKQEIDPWLEKVKVERDTLKEKAEKWDELTSGLRARWPEFSAEHVIKVTHQMAEKLEAIEEKVDFWEGRFLPGHGMFHRFLKKILEGEGWIDDDYPCNCPPPESTLVDLIGVRSQNSFDRYIDLTGSCDENEC